MVREALERGIHVFCEKPLVLDPVQGEALVRLAAGEGPGHPGRLPQPARRLLPRGQAAARPRRHRHGARGPRRGLRPGRRAHPRSLLALAPGQRWRQPLRLRRPPARPAHLVPRRPGVRRRRPPHQHPLHRDRRRRRRHDLVRRRHRGAQRQLVRRVAAQDVDPDHAVGQRRPDQRRPLRGPGPPHAVGCPSPRATRRAGTCATAPTCSPPRSSTCAARSTPRSSRTSSAGSPRATSTGCPRSRRPSRPTG